MVDSCEGQSVPSAVRQGLPKAAAKAVKEVQAEFGER